MPPDRTRSRNDPLLKPKHHNNTNHGCKNKSSNHHGHFDDSDAALPTTMQPMLANPIAPPSASRTNAELNLSVLQRHNPSIAHVLSIAPYAVIYTFASGPQAWEKTGIEGTLFVCQLATDYAFKDVDSETEERYVVIVLNRRGLDNFELELSNGDDVEITDEYVILQSNNQHEGPSAVETRGNGEQRDPPVIYGLWIFAEPSPSSTADMRVINAKVIQDCALRAEASRESAANKTSQSLQQSLTRHAATHPQDRPSFGNVSGQHVTNNMLDSSKSMNSTEFDLQPPTGGILDDLFRRARQVYSTNG